MFMRRSAVRGLILHRKAGEVGRNAESAIEGSCLGSSLSKQGTTRGNWGLANLKKHPGVIHDQTFAMLRQVERKGQEKGPHAVATVRGPHQHMDPD